MRAMILEKVGQPLVLKEIPIPIPTKDQVLIKVHACGICRTDLHILDGELTSPRLPLIMGHQIVGTIIQKGSNVAAFHVGDRVGVPWVGGSCGHCKYCLKDQENLCDHAMYTGYQVNGGFAEYCLADPRFIFPIPLPYTNLQAAPFLCGGLIGYRAYRMAQGAKRIGFYGFGSAAHMIMQLAIYQGCEAFVFTREGDIKAQILAKQLGAKWVGSSNQMPPIKLDAVLIFAPAGELIPMALQAIDKGGSVICAGIHMSSIPSFSYDLLYGEKILRSVTNLTRQDGEEFLQLAEQVPIQTVVNIYPLEEANLALKDLRQGNFSGSAVLQIADH
jgi:propanol-preferring alcohol dehydrogenase